MGLGYAIYCNKCFPTVEDIPKYDDDDDEGYERRNEYYNNYEVLTGGGFSCFCKEQLEEDYENILQGETEVIEIIKQKLNEGFQFGEEVGYLIYYCENCKILDNRYYFEMYKDDVKYTPEYKCKLCNEIEKTTEIEERSYDEKEETTCDLELQIENDIVKITDKDKNEFKIVCRKCNNDIFVICHNLMWD